jgi:hypothetical protein
MVEQLRPTFAEQDRIRAARERKAVECIERLKRVLVAEFDADEMRFIRNWDADSIRISAFQSAQDELNARR